MYNKFMTIDGQIRDEKLQYDINREAAKILAVSSNKIDKYEYLTEEEILPSNQKQIIEQAKFTYSPLGKNKFEKQSIWKTNKNNWRSRKKEVQALKHLKDRKNQPANAYDYEDELLISKQRKIFKNIFNKRLDKIKELTEKINDNDLEYITKSTGIKTNFSEKDDPLNFLNKIKKDEIIMEEAKKSQKDFNYYPKKIRGGNKTQEQMKTQANLNMLFNGRNYAINFIEGYGSMILEAKKKLLRT